MAPYQQVVPAQFEHFKPESSL